MNKENTTQSKRQTLKEQTKAWRQANKEKVNAANRKSYKNNKEKRRAAQKKYYENNKKRILLKHLEYERYKRATDELFNIRRAIRSNISNSFKRIKQNKPTNTLKLLGCTWEEAKIHFESLFQEGMTWENHGKWHIDHIKPVSSFSLDLLHLINHISNLQPLWAKDNFQKSNKPSRHHE